MEINLDKFIQPIPGDDIQAGLAYNQQATETRMTASIYGINFIRIHNICNWY